jgi:hypothetical protein
MVARQLAQAAVASACCCIFGKVWLCCYEAELMLLVQQLGNRAYSECCAVHGGVCEVHGCNPDVSAFADIAAAALHTQQQVQHNP